MWSTNPPRIHPLFALSTCDSSPALFACRRPRLFSFSSPVDGVGLISPGYLLGIGRFGLGALYGILSRRLVAYGAALVRVSTSYLAVGNRAAMAMEEEDLYAVLHLDDGGPHVSHATIRKEYRKRALELHPDKRGDDPVAAEEFQKLQRAYDILSDEKARASYDELQRVRKERVQKAKGQSEKRQKMMRDLTEKERAHERGQKAKSQEDDVQRRLKAQIAQITKARGRQFKGPSSFDPGRS